MRRNAFTLVELLIVVIILGILAAVVIPQFSDASTDARVSSLTTNLATIRGQIEFYKMQHTGKYPNLVGPPTFADGTTDFSRFSISTGCYGRCENTDIIYPGRYRPVKYPPMGYLP